MASDLALSRDLLAVEDFIDDSVVRVVFVGLSTVETSSCNERSAKSDESEFESVGMVEVDAVNSADIFGDEEFRSSEGVLVEIGIEGAVDRELSEVGGTKLGKGGREGSEDFGAVALAADGIEAFEFNADDGKVGGAELFVDVSEGSVNGGSVLADPLSLLAEVEKAEANGEVFDGGTLPVNDGASTELPEDALLKLGGGELLKLSNPKPGEMPVEMKGPVGPVMSGSMSTKPRNSGFNGVSVPFNATYPP